MQTFKFFFLSTLSIFLFINFGCQSDSPSQEGKKVVTPEPEKVVVPKFDRDSAFDFVAKQVEFGPRLPNTEGHRQTKEWLVKKFESYGLKVLEQPFQAKAYTGTVLNGTNIIARYNPGAKKRILLAAHWDTRHIADSPIGSKRADEPILGADDGGSGVGVLLEIARQLQANPADIGVDMLLFDAEDHGDDASTQPAPETWCLGSQYWSKNMVPTGLRPKYGILLDMVGARNTRFPREGYSMQFAPQLVDKVWKLGQSLGYNRFFVDEQGGGITDDHYFVNTIAKIPMIDIIGMPRLPGSPVSFGEHWHTQNDNLEIIDIRTLRAVGQTVLEVIYREAAGQF